MSQVSPRYDVAVVGAGPVGLAAAGFLGSRGWRVGIFDQETAIYPLPRAGHVDSEIMRLLQILGCADEFVRTAVPLREGVFWDSDGNVLTRLPLRVGESVGWFSDYLFYQPDFDGSLLQVIDSLPDVDVHRGQRFAEFVSEDGQVIARFEGREGRASLGTVAARYLLGCDGANSSVRQLIGSTWDDFGFQERWLVLDLRPNEPDMELDLPGSAQLCDPARPTSLFRWLGREHVRLEFMLAGLEDDATCDEKFCWALVERWGLTPANSDLVRRAVYTFRSTIASRWRDDRVLLVGDAAHLMPPFLGQGMCSGVRDAANLSWKLDLVLRGISTEDLLDSYQQERSPHVLALIRTSVEAGKIVCVTDPILAAQRNEFLRSLKDPPLTEPPSLTGGVQYVDSSGNVGRFAGTLSRQGGIEHAGQSGRLIDVLGGGWLVLSINRLDDYAIPDALRAVPVRHIQVSPANLVRHDYAIDLDGVYEAWFADMSCRHVVIRPDLYVYGIAVDAEELNEVLTCLERQLTGVGHVDGYSAR